MKHYYSSLVLSLFVFLNLVCPSPVMAELVSSLKVEAEDGLSIQVINSSNCSSSNMTLNTESKFGAYSGTGGMITSGGEVYLPLVIDYNGASYGSMTLEFQIRCGNNQDDRTYINFYQECEENESPDLRISSSGSYYNKYYKKYAYKKVYSGSWYQVYQTQTVSKSFTEEGSYLIGLYARDYAIYDYVQIIASAAIIQDGDEEPSCTAPDHVDVTGTWHIFNGDDIELTARAYSTEGTSDEITEGLTYQWYKNGTDEVNKIVGATSATYTKSNCTYSDAGAYYCKISTDDGCETCSDYYDVKMLRVYVKNSKGGSDYGYIDLIDLGGYEAQGTIRLATGGKTYGFGVADGCTGYYGNDGTMNSSSSTDWPMDKSYDCQLTSTSVATYTFTVKYGSMYDTGTYGSYIKVSVTYPSNNQASGKIIYFDNSLVNWSNVHYRIGKSNNVNYLVDGMIDVPGTASLKKMTTWAYSGFEAWHICDNTGWTGDNNTIYRTYTNNDEYQISNSIEFDGGAITDAAVTIVPRGNESSDHYTGGESGVNDNCQFYYYELKKYLWTHTATITTPTNGTIQIAYNDEEHTDEANKVTQTTTTSGLAHTTKLYISTTPATGYEQATLTVNGSAFDASYHVLSADATIAATFSLIDYDVTYSDPGNSNSYTIQVADGSAGSSDKTANMGQTITLHAVPTTGYDFTCWTITNNDNSTDITNSVSLSGQTEDATFTMPAANITITASFALKTYTVTYNAGTGAGITGSHANDTKTYGVSLTLPGVTFTRTGYTQTGWATSDGGSQAYALSASYTANEGANLYPVWTVKTTTITINANTSNHGSTGSSVTATWGNALPSFTAASGESGWSLKGYYTAATDGTKIINADGSLVANTDYATDDETPVWKYEGASVTFYPQYDLIICQSSRTYQVEDIMIKTAGAVTNHDTQATPSNVKIITSENQNYDSNTDDYFASISDGAFVYNTQAGSAVYMEVDVPSAGNYTLDVYSGKGDGKNVWVNVYTTTGSGDYISYGETNYYKRYNTQLNKDHSTYTIKLSDKNGGTGVDNKEYPEGKCIIGIYTEYANCALDKIVLTRVDKNEVFCKHTITVNTTSGASSDATADKSMALSGETVTVTAPAASSGYHFTGWTATSGTVTFADASSLSTTFVMPDEDVTLTANYAQDEYTISSLPWEGDQNLTGQTVVSAEAISSCFDSLITFTFSGEGTVSYYNNDARETLLDTVTSGTAITLDNDLRAHGIYIRCTSGAATLTAVSKTTIGSVYTIWSGSVAVSADYTGVNEAGEEVTLSAEAQNWWLQQVVLGPEHFQTAAVGDTLRVTYTSIEEYAKGAIQTATKYNAIPGYIYNESDGSTVSSNTREFDLPSSGYYHIITAGSLDSLKNKGIVVKGKGHTITRVSLHASCSNRSMRTTAPNKITYGDDESIDIMTNRLELEGEGFNLGNWEHKVELHKNCFDNVKEGSIINFYMKVQDGATLSFRCNVPSIIADDKQGGQGCPSYGDISFDRTIDDLYGDEPQLIGRIDGYKVLYLLVDADMLRRLKETGMILCGKGTLIKVVEGVPETVVVNSNEEKHVPTVVNNLTIYQGGEVTNNEDIEVLGKITYIRPTHDNGDGGKLGNNLDQWYTFTLPFTVDSSQVYDVGDGQWWDINAVNYTTNDAQPENNHNPDGAGHYYLQWLKSDGDNTGVEDVFRARWQYINPSHSLYLRAADYDDPEVKRYGYPMRDSAYIILFDTQEPLGMNYFDANYQVRFVGGPQTIEGVAKQWKIESDGEQYWMYANNTLHSFEFSGSAYVLDAQGKYFVLQDNPTIRPFECYVQATESLKTRCAAIPMRGFHIDNTPTGAESIQGSAIRAEKILRNGQLIIIRNGVEYDATGVVIR